MMEKGAAGIRAFRKEAEEKGFIRTAASAKLGLALGNAFHRIDKLKSKLFGGLGAAVAPAVLAATKPIESILISTNKWIKTNATLVQSIAAVVSCSQWTRW